MRLRQTLITNAAMLRNHFDFTEIWKKRQLFLKDIADIRPDMEKTDREGLKELLNQCVDEKGEIETKPLQQLGFIEKHGKIAMYEEIHEVLRDLPWICDGQRANAAAAVYAVYCLCGVSWKQEDREDIAELLCSVGNQAGMFRPSSGEMSASDGSCVELTGNPHQEPYRIAAFDYSETEGMLARVQYKNAASGSGQDIRIVVEDSFGILDEFLLKPGESLYANLLNGQFVEAVPNIALSSSHLMFYDKNCRWGQVPYALTAFDLEERRMIPYDFPALEQITEFSPDDSGGFVGVLKPDGLPMPCSEKTEFRRIYEHTGIARILLNNAAYLILQKDGRVWSNLKRANGWSGMLRVFLSADGEEAIGIKRDGSAVSTRGTWEMELEKASFAVFDNQQIAAKLPGGTLFFSGTAQLPQGMADKEIKSFGISGQGLRFLTYDGRLIENGCLLHTDRRFKEFVSQEENYAAVDTEGRILLVQAGKCLLDETGE